MRNTLYIYLASLLMNALFLSIRAEDIHPCSGAGFWFPAGKQELSAAIDGYLNEAKKKETAGSPIALISPHAGYTFAAPVMAAAYRQLEGHSYKRVIILAFSHSLSGFGKISLLPVEGYETPLGTVPIDKKMAEELLSHSDVFISAPAIHMREHSDENQIPFLQKTVKDFKMVSLLVDSLNKETMNKAVDILYPYMDKDTLFVASTDLTHYGFAYDYSPFEGLKGKELAAKIHKLDKDALEIMASADADGFREYINRTGATICGRNPVELLLRILKKQGGAKGEILQYYTSADKSGDYAHLTVGYGAVIFTAPAQSEEPKPKNEEEKKMDTEVKPKIEKTDEEPDPPILTETEQQTLLRLSRDYLHEIVKDRKFKPDISKYDLTPSLKQKSRLFVTLTKDGELRGCIGHVEAIAPIYEAVMDNTYSAAFRDPRFPPVEAAEVPRIRIEISINTPQRRLKDINDIIVGKHGLIIEKGWNRGLLLPQVPVEQGWNREQFLEGICRKAGLPRGAWKEKDTILYYYSSQVFHEK